MRLHRTITPDRPLLVVALEEEAAHLHVSELPVLVTGVGKVNAAVAVATTLGEFSPSRVVNLGTAGALHDGLAGTYVVRRVIQHDFDDEALYELTGLHAAEPIDLAEDGLVLATGDTFVTSGRFRADLAKAADLVDMEGYAVAHAAQVAGVPVTLVKEVSDSADAAAHRSWRDSIDICAERLGAWVRGNLLG
jgi:adenosylhomocysteine nucleosidase